MDEKRPIASEVSERVVVDSVFPDGTLRLLRARRKESDEDIGLARDAWQHEEECEVPREALEALLADELSGRRIREGDVLFVSGGPEFFEKKLRRISEVLASESGMEGEPGPLRRPDIEPERLILPLDESRRIARQEIRTQFARLVVTQNVRDDALRDRLFSKVEDVQKAKAEMEREALPPPE